MQRDHRLGFPAALLADTPAANTARYPLGRPKRDPEPQTWPFPLVKPAVTFVADPRTMVSDRPGFKGSLTLPLKEKPADPREASFKDFNEKLSNDTDAYARLIEMRGGCRCHLGCAPCHPCSTALTEDEALALGWEPPEPDKPAQAEPQADAEGWIAHDGKGLPVEGGTRVEVRLRRNSTHGPQRAAFWHDENSQFSNWVHEPCPKDIVAYRVVPA